MGANRDLLARAFEMLSEKTALEIARPCLGRPDLSILVAKADPAIAREQRARIPPERILLHVCPQGGADIPCPEEGRALLLAMKPDGSHREEVARLVRALKPAELGISVARSGEAELEAEAEALREMANLILANLLVDRYSSLARLRASLMNLPMIAGDGRVSAKLAEGCRFPALVCGAGPSLASQFDLIKERRECAVTVASGHAAQKLKAAGIEPDFIVEADPRCRRNWPPESSFGCPFVGLACVDPDVASRFAKTIWADGDSPEFSALCESAGLKLERLAMSRGVIVSAIDFALSLGCQEIALAGSDLSISAGGATHVGAARADGDGMSILEAEGSDSPKILTTRDFNDIRLALESYLESLKGRGVKVFNCTPGGAKIKHAERIPLEDFLKGEGLPSAKRFDIVPLPPQEEAAGKLLSAASKLGEYLDVCGKLADAGRRLERELGNSRPDAKKVNALRAELEGLARAETAMSGEEALKPLAFAAKSRAEDVFAEAHGFNPSASNPIGQLKLLRRKTLFASSLCEDFKGDLDASLRSLSQKTAGRPSRDPAAFSAYRDFALDFVAKSNPELAAALKSPSSLQPLEGRFDLHLKFEDVPHVTRLFPDGAKVQFSGLLSVREEARKLNADFIKESGFDPARHAVLFAAPGNWAIVDEFAKLCPNLRCMILDPWPELLAGIISCSLFLHRLPEDTPVIGAHESLPGWRKLYLQTIEAWRKKRLEVLYYKNPRTWGLPEAEALSKAVPGLASGGTEE